MSKINWLPKTVIVILFCLAAAAGMSAQTFVTLHQFDGGDGFGPVGTLVQGGDGNFYGLTADQGNDFQGSDFEITRTGYLVSRTLQGPYEPFAGLVQATNGLFYGTSPQGGRTNGGTVFRVESNGTSKLLYAFCTKSGCPDGRFPEAALVQGANGNLYGTTTENGMPQAAGTVFEISPAGTLTTLYSFCLQTGCPDGDRPMAALIQATNGNFYGTTSGGGAYGEGTVFEITPGGVLTTLHSFSDGAAPMAGGLMQAADGNFYGTTYYGGATGYGTIFKLTPAGKLTTLYSFCAQSGCSDGSYPDAGLIQATDGNFYGTTLYGGNSNCSGEGCGTIFEISPIGALTTLYAFCTKGGSDCADGAMPGGGLLQSTDGNFYGVTNSGGLKDCYIDTPGVFGFTCGTVFGLSVGLNPFVKTNPGASKVGAKVGILGTDLTGASSVTFNGTVAAFEVYSKTLIVAQVPGGATTGTVKVKLPGGTLSSNVKFIVLK